MEKEKLALDLSPYKTMSSGEALSSLADDLASLTLEASGEINPYYLVVVEDKVINPERPTTDIAEQFAKDTPLEEQETRAALQRRDFLLNLDGNYVVIWISPPNPYPRGSLDVGISRKIEGLRVLESYGVSINFSQEECLLLGKNTCKFSVYSTISPKFPTLNRV